MAQDLHECGTPVTQSEGSLNRPPTAPEVARVGVGCARLLSVRFQGEAAMWPPPIVPPRGRVSELRRHLTGRSAQ
jgi:hypothetical protein